MNFQKQLQIDKEILVSSILKGNFKDSLSLIFSILSKSSYDLGTSDAQKITDFSNVKIYDEKDTNNFYNLSYSSQLKTIYDEVIYSIKKEKFNDTFVTYYQLINKIYYDRGYNDYLKDKANKISDGGFKPH